jgi:hypothetical protein
MTIPNCLRSDTDICAEVSEDFNFLEGTSKTSCNSPENGDTVWFTPIDGNTDIPVMHTTPYPHPGPPSLLAGENYVENLEFITEGDIAPVVPVSTNCNNLQKIVDLIKNKDTRVPALMVYTWEQQALWALEFLGKVEESDTREYDPNDIFEYISSQQHRILASWQGPITNQDVVSFTQD